MIVINIKSRERLYFIIAVLLAKVKVILKRYNSNTHENKDINKIFENKGLRVDFQSGKVFINNNEGPYALQISYIYV